jgi:hypothetical protein
MIGALAETATAQAMILAPLARLHGYSTATLRAKPSSGAFQNALATNTDAHWRASKT